MNELTTLRRVTKRLRADRQRRDLLVREASENGATRREVAKAAGLSVGRVQQIVSRSAVLLLALLVFAPGAWGSKRECSTVNPCHKRVEAIDRVRGWESPHAVPAGAILYIQVTVNGHRLGEQLKGLRAYYSGHGVSVRVRARSREAPFVAKYVSFGGKRRVKLLYWWD